MTVARTFVYLQIILLLCFEYCCTVCVLLHALLLRDTPLLGWVILRCLSNTALLSNTSRNPGSTCPNGQLSLPNLIRRGCVPVFLRKHTCIWYLLIIMHNINETLESRYLDTYHFLNALIRREAGSLVVHLKCHDRGKISK